MTKQVNFKEIPQPMKLLKQWVLWRLEEKEGRKTKVPYSISGSHASTNDSATWAAFANARDFLHNNTHKFSGVGFVFTDKDPYVGVDLDKCFDDAGNLKPWAQKISDELGSYQELSPSGKGLHIIIEEPSLFKGGKIGVNGDTGEAIECYSQGRYFTVTGIVYKGHDKITKCDRFKQWHEETFSKVSAPTASVVQLSKEGAEELVSLGLSDEEVIEKCRSLRNKEKFALLYDIGDWQSCKFESQSSADLSLVNMLLTASHDVAQTDRLYRASKLMRGKWDTYRGKETYGALTIAKAQESLLTHMREGKIPREEDRKEKGSRVSLLVKEILSDPSIELFKDDFDKAYISFEVGNHKEQWPVSHSKVKSWILRKHFVRKKDVLSSQEVSNIQDQLSAHADVSSKKIKLSSRMAQADGVIWYDLCDDEWRAVKITRDGWSIENEPPILFKRMSHQMEQIEPLPGGDVNTLWEFLNIQKESQRTLYLAWLVSAFIPGIPRPIAYVYGSQGSAKSSLSQFTRMLVDPSKIMVTSMPQKHEEITQQLAHNSFIFYDNISKISEEESDLLCRAVTKAGFSKRQLYTDDGDIIFQVFTCIGLNGINNVVNRPDLLERCILFQLERISEKERKEESEQNKHFQDRRPYILGAIFTLLSRALAIQSTIHLNKYPRMADFAKWGAAITCANEKSIDDFMRALNSDAEIKHGNAFSSYPIAILLEKFMEHQKTWVGKIGELKEALKHAVGHSDAFAIYKDCGLDKPPNYLSRTLGNLKVVLEDGGIRIQFNTPRAQTITITKVQRKWSNDVTVSEWDNSTNVSRNISDPSDVRDY